MKTWRFPWPSATVKDQAHHLLCKDMMEEGGGLVASGLLVTLISKSCHCWQKNPPVHAALIGAVLCDKIARPGGEKSLSGSFGATEQPSLHPQGCFEYA